MNERRKYSSSSTPEWRCTGNMRAFRLSAAGEPSQQEANMGDVVPIFLMGVQLVLGGEGNAAFDNARVARVRAVAVAGAEESV